MSLTTKKEEILFQALHAGKERIVFDLLYKSCWPKILKYIRKNHGSRDEAEDIFHDALIIFIKQIKLRKFDPEQDADGYVFVISRNLWFNHVKKKDRQVPIEGQDPKSNEDIHQSFVSKEWENLVLTLMDVLGERCKELLSLTIFQGLKLDAVMEKMGFGSIDVVKTKHYKCKQRLIKVVMENESIKKYLRNG